ncbi:imelysin family protein [Desulfobulbus sp.]|uniref:imelysin family protein n=1 Tax=Desulfobulbus sp. TaxID=895 RepID=UPI0027B8C611|nr:imelysin family protein [Desulfobulbus sp.]
MKSGKNNKTDGKKLLQRPMVRIAGLVALAGVVCGAMLLPKSAAVQACLTQRKIDAVIADYADKVVLHTLERVVAINEALNGAVAQLQANATDAGVEEAAKAWRAARAQWQPIQSFAFGPAAFYDFDKQVASWPIDRPMIEHSIAQIAAGTLAIDSGLLRRKINSTQRGFFTAEHLLFRDGKPRKAAAIRPAELLYLKAVTQAIVEESLDFQASWAGSANLPPAAAARLKAAQLPERPSYAAEFAHPGAPGSRYFSRSVVLQEMFQESHTVVEDVCPLIEEWLGSADPRDSESQDSRNAAADLVNLLQGVENAYLGGVEGNRGRAMAELVAAKDEVIDRRIRIALADVRHRINAVGDPYGETTADHELKVRIAAASCWKLANKFAAAIVPVCMDPAAEPWAAYVPSSAL